MLWPGLVLLLLMLLPVVKGRSRAPTNLLSLWIDQEQVANLIGMPMEIPIIQEGKVIPYLREPELADQIIIPPEVDTVNLTWQAGDQVFRYWFENLTSQNPQLLYNPLLSIPTHGLIPHRPTVFQMSIPCTGRDKGMAHLMLGLRIYNRRGQPVDGTPISFRLKKQCVAFATKPLCGRDCQNGASCNDYGACECTLGFHGDLCDIPMCDPACENNGTCQGPNFCLCQPGYRGQICETARCEKPCQNGGQCLDDEICWCQTGFYGDVCEFSRCNPHCQNGATCVGTNTCACLPDFTGALCEHPVLKTETDRPRRSRRIESGRPRPGNRRIQKRKPQKRKDFTKKMQKTERRVIKIIKRHAKAWGLKRDERRAFRRLERDAAKRPLTMKERKVLLQTMNANRQSLSSKEKQKLRRLKKLMRLERRRLGKLKNKRKKKVFV